jgi:glycosyltransferase involved in cell wall biosynthesis
MVSDSVRSTEPSFSAGTERRMLLLSFLEPWSIGPGQGAPSLYETLAGYASAGWQVDYVTFHKRPLLGVAHERSVAVDVRGVTVHRFSLPRWRWLPAKVQAKLDRLLLFPLFALPMTLRLLRRRRPDVFYAYEASAIIAGAVLRTIGRQRAFVVHRIQGVSVLGNSYRRTGFMLRKLESLLSLRARADAYVMTDDGTMGDEVWRHWNRHIAPDRLLHIRNGIGAQLMAPPADRAEALAALGLDPAHRYVLMLSRLDPIKRIDRGIRAMAALRDRHPSVRLLIVGDGEDRPTLEALAHELGVADRLCFLGALDRSGVAMALDAADVFLSLYDHSNCGNPLFEALLHGLPVVTLDNGATGTVIAHGVNGLLLPVDDGARLNDALGALLDDPDERDRLRRGALTWARNNLVSWAARMDREVEWLAHRIST